MANSVSGSIIKIALIDSGVNYDPNINVVERKNFIENDENVSYLYEDISGHGTCIAGIIGSKEIYKNDTVGINPNVEIYSARVLNKDLSAPTSRVIEAINWAISKNVNIISISFGTTEESEALKIVIQDAYNAGILIIASSGNNGVVEYPAAYSEVMSVGSVNPVGNISEFSPRSDKVEIVAPGEDITSSAAFGGKMSGCAGTSLAVPHVVGVASELWQIDPTKSADFIRNLIDYSANLYGDRISYGNGLIDEKYAMKIYDKFGDNYSETDLEKNIRNAEQSGVLNNNPSKLNTSFIEGNWIGAGHQYLLSNSYLKANLTSNQYTAMMYGCTYPDRFLTDIKQFHGNLWVNGVDSNYIGCNIYLTEIASKLATSGVVSSTTVSNDCGMFSEDYTALNGKILCSNSSTGAGSVNGRTWSTICTDAGVSNTAANRAAFVYGLALHSSTDIIAHCSWWPTTDRYSWYKVLHGTDSDGDGTGNADDTDYIISRYDSAATFANNIIFSCFTNSSVNVSSFQLSDYCFNDGGNTTPGTQAFLLGNYKYYASLSNTIGWLGVNNYDFGDMAYQANLYNYFYQYTYENISYTKHYIPD